MTQQKISPLFVMILGLVAGYRLLFPQESLNGKTIGVDQGLSQGVITRVLQDNKGFIWVATQDGLNRYDGYEFKVFRRSLTARSSVSSNQIIDITRCNSDTIFILTRNIIEFFDPVRDEFKVIAKIDDESLGEPFRLLRSTDRKHQSLYLVTRKGFYNVDQRTGKIKSIFEYDSYTPFKINLSTIFEDSRHKIWFGRRVQEMFIHDPATGRTDRIDPQLLTDFDNGTHITSMVEDVKGDIIATDLHRIWKIGKESKKFEPIGVLPHGGNSFAMILAGAYLPDGKLLIGTSPYGLKTFDPLTGDLTDVNFISDHGDNVHERSINSLFIDNTGLIWAGTNGHGLIAISRFSNSIRKIVKEGNNPDIGSTRVLIQTDRSNILVAGYNFICLYNISSRTLRPATVSPGKHSDYVIFSATKAVGTRLGKIWLGGEGGGVYLYDPVTGEIKSELPYVDDVLPRSPVMVYSIYQDEGGILWVGSGTGLYSYDPESRKVRLVGEQPGSISAIYPLGNRKLAIGTHSMGMYILDTRSGVLKKESIAAPLGLMAEPGIRAFHLDDNGTLWIASTDGLAKIERSGKCRLFTTKDGLPNDMIYGMVPDNKGNIYLSTNRGISRFEPANNFFVNFSPEDGLQNWEFNSNAYYRDSTGKIYFGGISGFNVIDPAETGKLNAVPSVSIAGISIFNRQLEPGVDVFGIKLDTSVNRLKHLRLNIEHNDVSINLSAIDFNSLGRIMYSYQLKGFRDEWSTPSASRTIRFTNLEPGEYSLIVKAANKDGLWSEPATVLTIEIVPPFYRTWLFYIAVFTGIVAVIWLVIEYRVRNTEKQKRSLERIVTERTDELEKVNNELASENESGTSSSLKISLSAKQLSP